MRTYFDPNVLRQSWERWRWIIVCDVRNILVEKIFAIPASRGLCFLCVIVARLKNERIFSASVAWNQIQAANRDQRKYAQKRNKHPLVFRGVKPKWLSAKPCSFLCQKNFSTMNVDSSRAYVSSPLSMVVLLHIIGSEWIWHNTTFQMTHSMRFVDTDRELSCRNSAVVGTRSSPPLTLLKWEVIKCYKNAASDNVYLTGRGGQSRPVAYSPL